MKKVAKVTLLSLFISGFSGMAAAAQVGGGTVTMSGSIAAATCSVTASANQIIIPGLDSADIIAAAANDALSTESISFDFTDCHGIGNTLEVAMTRDVLAPTGVDTAATNAGFNYTGGVSTDSATGPLYFNVNSNAKSLNLDGTTNNVDITGFNLAAFSLPLDFVINKAPDNGVSASQYAGSYNASVTYSISYP